MVDINVCTVYVCARVQHEVFITQVPWPHVDSVSKGTGPLFLSNTMHKFLSFYPTLCTNFPTAIKPPLRSELPKYIQIYPNTSKYYRFVIVCVYTYMHFYKYTYIIIYIHIYICVSAGSAFDSGTLFFQMIWDKCFLVDGCNFMQPAWIVIII